MTTTLDARTPPSTRTGQVTVLPVHDGDRPVGAWIVGADTAVFRPVVDVDRLAAAALAVAAAATIATVAATRRRPAIGTVTMGPGGWISLKRTTRPPLRSAAARPWWARMLRARRLVVER
jgi:hypothetical protein